MIFISVKHLGGCTLEELLCGHSHIPRIILLFLHANILEGTHMEDILLFLDPKAADDMAWGSQINYLVHVQCLLFWTFFFMSKNAFRQILDVVWQWSLNSWCHGHIIFYVVNYINITSVFQLISTMSLCHMIYQIYYFMFQIFNANVHVNHWI